MTNKDLISIVELSIDKAIENKWDPIIQANDEKGIYEMKLSECEGIEERQAFRSMLKASLMYSKGNLFAHSFCKAFWDKDWESHIQKMVLEEEPIGYLQKFVDYEYEKVKEDSNGAV